MFNISNGQLKINGTAIQLDNIIFNDSIKHGNSGIVVFGEDKLLGRLVAVKFWLSINLLDKRPKELQGLLEARKAAQFNHPSFAQVYYGNKNGDYFFIVQEYVEGETLKEWLETQPSMSARGEIWDYLYMAIKFAHGKGIYHGDLHWKNIMVTPEQSIKVIDFGTSHFNKSSIKTRKRESDILKETTHRMFPEYNCYRDLLIDTGDLIPEAVLEGLSYFLKFAQELYEIINENFDDYDIRNKLKYLSGYITWSPIFNFAKVYDIIKKEICKKYPHDSDFLLREFLTDSINCYELVFEGKPIASTKNYMNLERFSLYTLAIEKYHRMQRNFVFKNNLSNFDE